MRSRIVGSISISTTWPFFVTKVAFRINSASAIWVRSFTRLAKAYRQAKATALIFRGTCSSSMPGAENVIPSRGA